MNGLALSRHCHCLSSPVRMMVMLMIMKKMMLVMVMMMVLVAMLNVQIDYSGSERFNQCNYKWKWLPSSFSVLFPFSSHQRIPFFLMFAQM